jgi:3-phenylpropionate/trans-cinnamate dioxygenase ferredoxin subunit
MSFVRACSLAEVPDDEAVAVTVGDYAVAIARDGDGVFALQDQCTHQAVPLSEGEVYDGRIECYLHGSCFDLRTGVALNLPATEPVSTFPLEVRDGDVFVDTTRTLNDVKPS